MRCPIIFPKLTSKYAIFARAAPSIVSLGRPRPARTPKANKPRANGREPHAVPPNLVSPILSFSTTLRRKLRAGPSLRDAPGGQRFPSQQDTDPPPPCDLCR